MLEGADIKRIELHDKIRNKCVRRLKLVVKTKFCGGNLINVYKCQNNERLSS